MQNLTHLLRQFIMEYMVFVEKKLPTENELQKTFQQFISGEITLPYETGVIRSGDAIDKNWLMTAMTKLSYRAGFISEIRQYLADLNLKSENLLRFANQMNTVSATFRPHDSFLYVMSPEDVVESSNATVSDAIYSQVVNEEIVQKIQRRIAIDLSGGHTYLKIVKPVSDRSGYSVGLEGDGVLYAYKVNNTSFESYFQIPSFKTGSLMVDYDVPSEIYLAKLQFSGFAWVRFLIAPEIFKLTHLGGVDRAKMFFSSNVDTVDYRVSFFNSEIDIQPRPKKVYGQDEILYNNALDPSIKAGLYQWVETPVSPLISEEFKYGKNIANYNPSTQEVEWVEGLLPSNITTPSSMIVYLPNAGMKQLMAIKFIAFDIHKD